MNEPNRDEQDRWRELHELLGLSGSAAPPPPPATQAPEPIAYVHDEPRSDQVIDEELPPPAMQPGDMDDDLAAMPPPQDVEIPLSQGEELAPPERGPREEDDGGQRRGRKRGRRGRRSRGGQRDEGRPQTSMSDDDTEVEPTEDEAARLAAGAPAAREHREPRREPQRGRGQPRRDDETFADAATEEVSRAPVASASAEDEPMETFADWNVPSWQEIIGSLYRPER